MHCDEIQKFVHAYIDGEFADADQVAFSTHLSRCETCRRVANFEKRIRTRIRTSSKPMVLPSSVKNRISDSFEQVAFELGWMARWKWTLIPAVTAMLLIGGTIISKRVELSSLAEDTVRWHRQHVPMDVSGSNFDSVRQFFSDKVPFAVRPPHFSNANAKLVGARLTNLGVHPAAYLVYQLGNQRISVFVVDPNALPVGTMSSEDAANDHLYLQGFRGYNVAMFQAGDSGYAVAADLDRTQLVRLIANSTR